MVGLVEDKMTRGVKSSGKSVLKQKAQKSAAKNHTNRRWGPTRRARDWDRPGRRSANGKPGTQKEKDFGDRDS